MKFNSLSFILGVLLFLPPFSAQAVEECDLAGEHPGAVRLASPAAPTAVASIGPTLAGKPWRLEKLINESLPEDKEAPYLFFTNAGDLMGFGGCNYFVGRYRIGVEGKLIVSSLRASHQQCQDTSGRETTLLTSLLLANSMQLNDDGLSFFMNGGNLMKMVEAPAISVDELQQQGKLLKAKKSRGHKTRGKKNKGSGKTKKAGKKAVAKASGTKLRNSAKPAIKH